MIRVSEYNMICKGEILCVFGREKIPCPCCGGKLRVYGTCIRKVREAEGLRKYGLRVFQCRQCRKFHREIPDCIIPYKRMGLAAFCETAASGKDQYLCEESTWLRVRRWMEWFLSYASHVEQSLLCSGLVFMTKNADCALARRARYFVRLVVNSGNWIHNRSAMTVLEDALY